MSSLTTLESDIDSRCVEQVGRELAGRAQAMGFCTSVHDVEGERFATFDEPSRELIGDPRWQAVLDSKRVEWAAGAFRGGTGCSVWTLPIERRGRVIGWVLLHRFDQDALQNAYFEGVLENDQARAAFEDHVGTDVPDAELLCGMLRQMIQDLVTVHESKHDADDLSERLGEAYETLDLLYELGRSMRSIDNPQRFVVQVCNRIKDTLGFGYVALHVGKDFQILPAATIWEGDDGAGPESLEDRNRLLAAIKSHAPLTDWKDSLGAVVRHISNDYGTDALIVAGDKITDGGHISSYDTKLIEAASSFTSTFLSNAKLFDVQKRLFVGIVESLSAAIDAKDAYTEGHSRRVAYLGEQIAKNMGLKTNEIERVHIAGLLHDVGKIGVPEAVLCKPSRLTDEEFEEIKKHPEIGYRILKDLTGLEDVLPGVLHHHERLDGRGYPHGLKGDEIPQMARILACADTFDAMSSNRAYRSAMPREKVLAELERCKGTQFDPEVVDAFLKIDLTEYDRMVAEEAGAAQRKIDPTAEAA